MSKSAMVLLLFGTEVHIRGRRYDNVSRSSWKRISELMHGLWQNHEAEMVMIQGGFIYELASGDR